MWGSLKRPLLPMSANFRAVPVMAQKLTADAYTSASRASFRVMPVTTAQLPRHRAGFPARQSYRSCRILGSISEHGWRRRLKC